MIIIIQRQASWIKYILVLSDEAYMYDLFKNIVSSGDTDDNDEESENSNDDFQPKRRRRTSFESENSNNEQRGCTNETEACCLYDYYKYVGGQIVSY